jgi:hypothetical protein
MWKHWLGVRDKPGSGSETSADSPAAISDAKPTPTLAEHEAEKQRIANEKARNELGYGKVYAYGALTAMAIQVLIADAAFYLYGHAYHWRIPVGAIQFWLGAIVVQVIGVVLVIAKSLFPSAPSAPGSN